jgi:phage baseplate assembly protein gpV
MSMQRATEELMNLYHAEMERTIEDRIAHPRQGRVIGYNPSTPHLIQVAILPEADFPIGDVGNYTTDWIPYNTICPGAGWGIYAPPSIGDQVSLIFQEHDRDAPIVIARINDDNTLPGVTVQSGEFYMLNKFGVELYFKADGSRYSKAPSGYTFVGNGTLQGNWIVTGTLTVQQGLTAAAGAVVTGAISATGDIIAGFGSVFTHLLTHVHSGVTTGSGDTGAPVARTSLALFRVAKRLGTRVMRSVRKQK